MIYQQAWRAFALLIALPAACQADIFRWDNGELIPGTEGVEPGPTAQLDHRDLPFARFTGDNLRGAMFESSNLANAYLNNAALHDANLSRANFASAFFSHSSLISANFAGANLADATFDRSTLTNANLAGALVTATRFHGSPGFTKEQLYSTANYWGRNLQRIVINEHDVSGWDFSGQNLTGAGFSHSRLSGADFTGAVVTGVSFSATVGFTKEQLYSTASYQAKDLQGIKLSNLDLSGWDFSGQNLSKVNLSGARLHNANLSGAMITGAVFYSAVGFTKEQLYSTASYQAKDLRGVQLYGNDLEGWDFSGQDLTGAELPNRLNGANFSGAIVTRASFHGDITKEQLYSTASYQAKDLHGIVLLGDDLRGWNFGEQDLSDAKFSYAELKGTDFAGAIVNGASFANTTSRGFTKEQLYSTASYQGHDLHGIILSENDLSDWDFSGQNLTNASLALNLLNTNFSGADLRGAAAPDLCTTYGCADNLPLALETAILDHAILPDGNVRGLSLMEGQLLRVRDYDGRSIELGYGGPELEPIPISIQDQLAIANDGVLQLVFEEDDWDSIISFEPGIPVQLAGALELTFSESVDVATQIGRTLRIFDWTGVSPIGQFAIRSPYVWDVANLYTKGEVTLVAVPEPSAASILFLGVLAFAARHRLTIV